MATRSKIDTSTLLYDVEAEITRKEYGVPGDPKSHVPRLLERFRKKKPDPLNEYIDDIRRRMPEFYKREGHTLSLDNPDFVSILFESRRKGRTDHPLQKSVKTAFDKAGLNIENPLDWWSLLRAFCWAHFGDHGKPGASVRWSNEKYRQLLIDVHQAKKRLNTKHDSRAVGYLLKHKSKDYPKPSLGKVLRQARDIRFNTALRRAAYDMVLGKDGEHRRLSKEEPVFQEPHDTRQWLIEQVANQQDFHERVESKYRKQLRAAARTLADRMGAGEKI